MTVQGYRMLEASYMMRALQFQTGHMANVLDRLGGGPSNVLRDLSDSFGAAAGAMGNMGMSDLLQSGQIPPPFFMPPPAMRPGSGNFYARPQKLDLKSFTGNRFAARAFEAALRNPATRAKFEMMVGGRVVAMGKTDGKIFVEPFRMGAFPGGGRANHSLANALDYLNQMTGGAAGGGGPNNIMNGLRRALQAMLKGMFDRADGKNDQNAAAGAADGQGNVNGAGGAGGAGEAGGDSWGSLNDPGLTVEDKITLMMFMILKQFDKDIEDQAKKVENLQKKKSQSKGKDGGNTSIDVEAMKMSRLVTKRQQMSDILRQIVDKYNQTGKGVIDSIGR